MKKSRKWVLFFILFFIIVYGANIYFNSNRLATTTIVSNERVIMSSMDSFGRNISIIRGDYHDTSVVFPKILSYSEDDALNQLLRRCSYEWLGNYYDTGRELPFFIREEFEDIAHVELYEIGDSIMAVSIKYFDDLGGNGSQYNDYTLTYTISLNKKQELLLDDLFIINDNFFDTIVNHVETVNERWPYGREEGGFYNAKELLYDLLYLYDEKDRIVRNCSQSVEEYLIETERSLSRKFFFQLTDEGLVFICNWYNGQTDFLIRYEYLYDYIIDKELQMGIEKNETYRMIIGTKSS